MTSSRKDPKKISYKSATSSGGSVAIVGNVTNSPIQVTGQPVDRKDFLDQLARLRQELDQADLDPAVAQDLAAEVQGVQEQAEREKPNVPMILGKLKTVADVVSGATNAATKLAPTVQKLIEMASTLGLG